MEIESTPLYREALRVMTSGATTANTSWKCKIHYGENNTFDPIMMDAFSYERDYRSSFSDVKIITVKMGLGDYSRLIYPNRTLLQVTLTKTPLAEGGNNVDTSLRVQSERYTAILLDGPKSATIGQGSESNSQEALNLSQIIDVHFQLYEKEVEQIRTMMTGGLYRDDSVGNVLRTILTNGAANVDSSAQNAIAGVDMIKPDNADIKSQVVIPHGVRLVDAADFLQNRYGIYNSGVGTYVQNKMWYVYTLYDSSRFKQQTKTLTILVLPKRKFDNVERSFMLSGDSLTVLATSETAYKDDSGTQYINTGNGVRYSDASTLITSGFTVADNKVVASRGTNNAEFIAEKVDTGINHAPLSSKRITANPFAELSFLAAKRGGMFKCTWQNSDTSLLYPGMGVRVVYSDGNAIQSVYGVLHAINHISMRAAGFSSDRFSNHSVLGVFVNDQVVPYDQ